MIESWHCPDSQDMFKTQNHYIAQPLSPCPGTADVTSHFCEVSRIFHEVIRRGV